MSEIAGDCNMSTGNLYRYFPSKLDIAEAFVRRLRTEHLASLRAAASAPGLSTAERLRAFFQEKLRLVYDRFHDRPKAYELSQEIVRERPAFASEWEKAEARLIVEILNAWGSRGELEVGDPEKAARILQDAFFRFSSSAVIFEGDHASLAQELDELMGLILDGFAYRRVQGKA
jgi:AcrR family transcriptional regulator